MLIEPAHSLTGDDVAELLGSRVSVPRLSQAVRTDQGPEFTCKTFDQWAYEHGVTPLLIQAGKPTQNAYIESFNGKLRDECLTSTGSVIYIKHKKSLPLGEQITMNNDAFIARLADAGRICGQSETAHN